MNIAQLITVVFSVGLSFIAVLTGVLLNNTRLTDLRVLLEGRLTAEIRASQAETRQVIAELRILIERNHSEMLARFADLEQRLGRLEAERRVIQ